LLLVFR